MQTCLQIVLRMTETDNVKHRPTALKRSCSCNFLIRCQGLNLLTVQDLEDFYN